MSYKLTVTRILADGAEEAYQIRPRVYTTAANVRRYGRFAVHKAIKAHGEIDSVDTYYAREDVSKYDGGPFALKLRTWNRNGSAGLRIRITQENGQ